MAIMDKLHLLRPSNATYLFNLTLVLLFLILPAITGPGSKIWWMTISYSVPGTSGPAAGSDWKMGGLGVCKSGEECTGSGNDMAPAVSGQIKSALMYHFAAAAMVFLIGVAEIILIPRQGGLALKWITFFLPVFGTLIVISVMAVDLIIRSLLLKDETIGEVRTEAVFWLSVSAVFSAIFWAISAFQLQRQQYGQTADKLREAEENEKAEKKRARAEREEAKRLANDKTFVQRLWPWSR